MIRIPITEADIEDAKKVTKQFDDIKTHDKYHCKNNYLGYLGERLLHKWFFWHDIPHTWEPFLKQGWSQPDFIINGSTFDLKTTFGYQLMVSKVQFDYYIFSRVNKDLKTLFVIGYIKGKKMQRMIDEGKCEIKKIEDKVNYLFPISEMKSFEDLFLELFKNQDKWTTDILKELEG